VSSLNAIIVHTLWSISKGNRVISNDYVHAILTSKIKFLGIIKVCTRLDNRNMLIQLNRILDDQKKNMSTTFIKMDKDRF
jgi:hypothetical protein